MLGAGFAMALGALTGGAQATQPLAQATQQTSQGMKSEMKATHERKRKKSDIDINTLGGLDINPLMFSASPSPIYYGKSQRKGKINKQRCSHNAKLKRRRAA